MRLAATGPSAELSAWASTAGGKSPVTVTWFQSGAAPGDGSSTSPSPIPQAPKDTDKAPQASIRSDSASADAPSASTLIFNQDTGGACADRYSMRNRAWPELTGSPSVARISTTWPATSEGISFIIFMLSMMQSTSPTLIWEPRCTKAAAPGDGAA